VVSKVFSLKRLGGEKRGRVDDIERAHAMQKIWGTLLGRLARSARSEAKIGRQEGGAR